MSGQLHALAALSLGKKSPLLIMQEAWMVLEPLWTQW